MNGKEHFVFVTQNRLAEFARYDTGFTDLIEGDITEAMDYRPEDVECESNYPMTLQDLRDALEEFNSSGIDVYTFLLDWWFPMLTFFYKALCLDELMGSDPSVIGRMEVPDIPDSEEDLLVTIFNVIDKSIDIREYSKTMPPALNKILDLESMIEMIDNYMEDRDLPITERTYNRAQKIAMISHWNNNKLLEDANPDIKLLFRRFTDELSDSGDPEAIKIKAYALYGGNPVYECDYKEAARLFEILWKDYSFGYAANTLGFIYFDGKLDQGTPNYERAFYYFSVASAFNITESKYMLADMFMNGYYVSPNPSLAFQTYLKLYNETRYRFESGDAGCSFADCAYRLGNALRVMPWQEVQRYKLLLEARYAINRRLAKAPDFGDLKVKREIESSLEDSRQLLKFEHRFKTGRSVALGNNDSTQPIEEFVSVFPGISYELRCKKLKSGKLKIKLVRLPEREFEEPRLSLLTLPWADFCGFVDTLEFTVARSSGTDMFEYFLERNGQPVIFSALEVQHPEEYKNTSTIAFFDKGEMLFRITTDTVFYNKPRDKSE